MSIFYNIAKSGFGDATEDWDTKTYKITLVSNNYTAAASHNYCSAFSGAELSSTSFTGGFNGTMRLTLGSRTVTQNNTDNQGECDAADSVWSGLSAGTAYALVIFRESGTDAVSPLIAYLSATGLPLVTNGGDVRVSWANSGIFAFTSA